METNELYRGRLIDHLHIVVGDIVAAKKFYTAVFTALEIPLGGEASDYFWADEFFVSTKESKAALGKTTGRCHFAFQAKNRAMVERFHALGLEAGGKDNGAPGERPYHPGYYAAFLIDPDGNNVESVYHGPAKQTANAIKITFEA